MGGKRGRIEVKSVPISDDASTRAVHLGRRRGNRGSRRSQSSMGNEALDAETLLSIQRAGFDIAGQPQNQENSSGQSEAQDNTGEFILTGLNPGDDSKALLPGEEEEINTEEDKQEVVRNLGGSVREAQNEVQIRQGELSGAGEIQEAQAAGEVVNDLERINQSMQQVAARDFVSVPMQRQKPSGWRKFWSRATTVFGKVTQAIVNTVTAPFALYKRIRAGKRLQEAERRMQESRNYETIPGWGGATYEKPENGEEKGEDILNDQRRVPTVWSYLTAGKAEIAKDEPAPPTVSVMVDQPKEGSAQSLDGAEMGHAMIGIEYTRYSNITKRNERYGLKYGFYPTGGLRTSGRAVMAVYNARVPGELQNDKNHAYTISRRYPATMEQVGAIVKASEKYADEGYGYYSRNCTTFVKEMMVDKAGIISEGDGIFRMAEVGFSPSGSFFNWAGNAAGSYLQAGADNIMSSMADRDDLTYQAYGNKRVTREDVARYRSSLNESTFIKSTYIPAKVGEELRLNESGRAGELGSMSYAGSLGKSAEQADVNIVLLQDELFRQTSALEDLINIRFNGKRMPEKLASFVRDLPLMGSYELSVLEQTFDSRKAAKGIPEDEPKEPYEFLSAVEIRDTRQTLEEYIRRCGNVYEEILKSDAKFNLPFMHLISLLQMTVQHLDGQYEKSIADNVLSDRDRDVRGALHSLESVRTDLKFDYNDKEYTLTTDASSYEAYLQINGDPVQAAYHLFRFTELSKKEDNGGLNAAEKEEYKRLKIEDDLAEDFKKSHRYMLERETYSQQDIDYVMKNAYKEDDSGLYGTFATNNMSSSKLYQSLIMEKVFGGMRQTFLKGEAEGGFPEEAFLALKDNNDASGLKSWLSGYIKGCIERNRDSFIMILRGVKNATKGAPENKEMIFIGYMFQGYLIRALLDGSNNERLSLAADKGREELMDLLLNPDNELCGYIKGMIP